MGRHSMRRIKPLHSAHGALYWTVVMWPVALRRSLAPRRLGWRGATVFESTPPAPSHGSVPTFRTFVPARPDLAETWRTEEGGVHPTW
jgi:hypothetical protein